MSTATAALDRIVIFIVSAILIGGGVMAILAATNVDPIAGLQDNADYDMSARWAEQPWFTWVLVGVAVIGILMAIWFIAANAKLRRPDAVIDSESDESGELQYTLGTVANGAAAHLERTEGVRKVGSRAEVDRGQETLTFTVNVDEPVYLPRILAECDETAADIADAVDHGHDTGVRFLVNIDSQR